jgi:hypothetical protein
MFVAHPSPRFCCLLTSPADAYPRWLTTVEKVGEACNQQLANLRPALSRRSAILDSAQFYGSGHIGGIAAQSRAMGSATLPFGRFSRQYGGHMQPTGQPHGSTSTGWAG